MRTFLTQRPRYQKRLITLMFDTLCVWTSLCVAFFIRLGNFNWLTEHTHGWPLLFVIAPLTALPFFVRMGLYRAVLRYINTVALTTIVKAVIYSTITLMVADALLLTDTKIPRSIPFLYFLSLCSLMIGSRYLMQRWLLGIDFSTVMQELLRHKVSMGQGRPVLVYGRGQALLDLVGALNNTRDYQPVVIIDMEGSSQGGEIDACPIYGEQSLDSAIEQFKPDEILLAFPKAGRVERQSIIQRLEPYGLSIKTMPSWDDLAAGRMKIQDVQEVDIGDVLGREEVQPVPELMAKCISGKVVMVSGAGGSIGSEICRQIIQMAAQQIIILDHSEYSLYAIDREIRNTIELQQLNVDVVTILASVKDQDRMYAAMKLYGVDTVYHAAAYKHVPLVEHNVSQGIINNVLGTVATAQSAIAANVSHFVLISTDKAVRPTNVMGASKRLAELVLQALSGEPVVHLYQAKGLVSNLPEILDNKTCFTMVRFGNVLGSSGSVIPVFREQIRLGGPITVTHPEITRYFMSIPEASQLVIQAGAMGQGGDVFVLDMGEPVKITDLAERMVQLSGLSLKNEQNPDGDIEITFSGLRPGEKLYEELLIGDSPQETQHQRIFKANEQMLSWEQVTKVLSQLEQAILAHDYEAIRGLLEGSVNGFTPDDDLVDWLKRWKSDAVKASSDNAA